MSREYILTAHISDANGERNLAELVDVIESMDTPQGIKLGKYELIDRDTKEALVGRP